MSEKETKHKGVPPEGYELYDHDEGKYFCPFCDGRMLRVGNTAECTECGEKFKRRTDGQQTTLPGVR